MKILVLVKQVPVIGDLAFDPATRTLQRDGVRLEVSAFDVRALLRAVELRAAAGGEVVAMTMGPPQAREALAYCLALGADRAVHLCDPAFAGADTLATARALAAAVRREPFDLILCGRASVDAETGQVGPELAELLDLAQVTCVGRLDVEPGGRLAAERETDEGFERIACAPPVVLSVTEDLAPERFPKRAEREAAAARPIVTVTAADLGADPATLGAAGSPTWVAGLEELAGERAGQVLEGTPEAIAAELVQMLAARGLFGGGGEGDAPRPEPTAGARRDGAVWVVAETRGATVRRATLELLTKARALTKGDVVAVLIGHDVREEAERLGRYGAGTVLVADHPVLADYATEPFAAILADLIAARAPSAVLLSSTYVGRDLAPRVAARLGLGLTGDCIDLSIDDEGRLLQWKPAFGGNVVAPILSHTRPEMATIRPGLLAVATPDPAARAVIEDVTPAAIAPTRVAVVDRRPAPGVERAAALDEAEVAIGVGIGLGGPEALDEIETLAQALGGAALAATRDVTDKGWLPRQHQVGLTGRAIAPRFYFAIGVRGAFEHTVGLRRAGTIVAINRNPKAPIFKQADLGVVAEWQTFVPLLVGELRRVRPG